MGIVPRNVDGTSRVDLGNGRELQFFGIVGEGP